MLAADLSPCAAQSCLISLAQPLLQVSPAAHMGLMERMRMLWVWLLITLFQSRNAACQGGMEMCASIRSRAAAGLSRRESRC